jgi:hypothetical protein
MTIDYARLAIGLAPLGIAIGVIAILHLRSKPTVVTSGQEVLLLGFAVSGFAMIGPMELFFPTSSYAALGEWVWVLLAALYFFFVLLASLLSRSSLTVVGLSPDRLQESLVTALATEDIEGNWLGKQLDIPDLGVRGIIEGSYGFPSTSHLWASGGSQNPLGWYRLEKMLVGQWAKEGVINQQKAVAWCFLLLAAISLGLSVYWMVMEIEQFRSFFQRVLL